MERITSRENQYVKEFIRLAGSKSRRESAGLFVMESRKLLEEAITSGVRFERIFATDTAWQKNHASFEKLLKQQPDVFCCEITDSIEKKMTQTGNAQGIFAVCKKLDKHLDVAKIENNGKYVFLCHLQDTGNVGAIIRTAEAMGIHGLIISHDTCDLTSIKVLRSSMGSVFRMRLYQSRSVLEDLKFLNRHFTTFASVPDHRAESLSAVNFPENTVMLIGNEGNGLEQEIIEECSRKVTIQMKGNTESFNASTAAAILMWEMTK